MQQFALKNPILKKNHLMETLFEELKPISLENYAFDTIRKLSGPFHISAYQHSNLRGTKKIAPYKKRLKIYHRQFRFG